MKRLTHATERGVFAALTAIGIALYALYFVHLRADYPALLPAVDWARYTDEGWYGGAALHSLHGAWFTPGGFNPAVALPAWPLLLRGWFAVVGGVLGQGIVAARVLAVLLFGGTALLSFALLRPLTGRVLAAAAVLLMLADPFCYGFDRLAILEPLVTFLLMLALWAARPRRAAVSALRAVSVGLLLTALVLTKTTAVLLAPAVLFLLWHAAQVSTFASSRGGEQAPLHAAAREPWQHPSRAQVVAVAIAAATACGTWLAYFFLLVRPHHRADFHHIFAVNAGHASGHTLLQAIAHAVGDATWMGAVLWPLTLLLVLLSVRYLRELWRVPLFGAAVLAIAFPIAFIGWHTWFIPHYYLPCVPPMLIALALALHALSRRAHALAASRHLRLAHTAAMLVAEFAFAVMLAQTLAIVVHPRYTLAGAAADIAQQMRAGQPPGAPEPKLLAASADTFALLNGTASANPEWPIGGLPALVTQEQPGWYGGYLPYDAAHIAAMRKLRPLTEVARYRIQPTPDHAEFVLYRVGP